jgi:hypothetical protein
VKRGRKRKKKRKPKEVKGKRKGEKDVIYPIECKEDNIVSYFCLFFFPLSSFLRQLNFCLLLLPVIYIVANYPLCMRISGRLSFPTSRLCQATSSLIPIFAAMGNDITIDEGLKFDVVSEADSRLGIGRKTVCENLVLGKKERRKTKD